MLQGGRNTAPVGSPCSVWATLGLPPLTACVRSMCAFLVYTAQAPGCSARELSEVGPGLHALPRSTPLRFRFSGAPPRHRLGWACVLCPSQIQAAQATRCSARCALPRCSASYHLPGPSHGFPGCAAVTLSQVCLLWGADLWLRPSWPMSTGRLG